MGVLWRPDYFTNHFTGRCFAAFTELHTMNHFHFLSQHVGVLAFLHSQSSMYSGISPDDLETQLYRFTPVPSFYWALLPSIVGRTTRTLYTFSNSLIPRLSLKANIHLPRSYNFRLWPILIKIYFIQNRYSL